MKTRSERKMVSAKRRREKAFTLFHTNNIILDLQVNASSKKVKRAS